MKKAITMILAITLAILAVVPSDKANAEEAVGTAPADVPVTGEIKTNYHHIRIDGMGLYSDGETAAITKGFSPTLSVDYTDPSLYSIQWSSSNPDVVSIDANGKATAKNYGSTTIRALTSFEETGDWKIDITVKVVKNEYTAEVDGSGESITSMKFDKKGNLKCVFTVIDKLSKSEIKEDKKDGHINLYKPNHIIHRSICNASGMELVIKDAKRKVIFRKRIANKDKDNFCCSNKKMPCHDKKGFDYKPGLNKPRYIKFTVKKKDLGKLKGADLRKCWVEFH